MIATDDRYSPAPELRPDGWDGTSRAGSDRSYLYPHAWPPGRTEAGFQPAAAPNATAGMSGHRQPASEYGNTGARAIIGDELRLPVIWCQLGSCISRFSDASALGESDVRSRAAAAGWREDAMGRLACPGCVQHDPTFWVTYPVVPWPLADTEPASEARPAQESPAQPDQAQLDHAQLDHAQQDAAQHDADQEDPAQQQDPDQEYTAWAGLALPHLNLALVPDEADHRTGLFRRRDSGRHRQII